MIKLQQKTHVGGFGVMFLIGFVISSMTGTTFYDPAGLYPQLLKLDRI